MLAHVLLKLMAVSVVLLTPQTTFEPCDAVSVFENPNGSIWYLSAGGGRLVAAGSFTRFGGAVRQGVGVFV